MRKSEKLQWYKLHHRDPLMQRCADKYAVREYLQEIGYGHLLNELYGVYQSVREIEVVLNMTCSCGRYMINN